MKKTLPGIILLSLTHFCLLAQKTDSVTQKRIETYYKQALRYKEGNGVPMDYTKAYDNFSKAADLGDAQSVYAAAYMHYKGLGCTQDYEKAARLFAEGAKKGKDNSMYFYGLCWRNGYGVNKNEDSARYWLNKSAATGYKQAVMELQMRIGENINDSAARLVQQISNAAIPDKKVLNSYNKIQHYMPPTEMVSGEYKGYIIQYDWSGKYIVSSKGLQLSLLLDGKDLSGLWIEDAADTVKLSAALTSDSVSFNQMQYSRKDHYSPESGIKYNFQQARLNLVQTGDSIFLAGNVAMFSPQRGEPSKPLMIALVRTDSSLTAKKLQLRAYPNPFTNVLTAQFEIPQPKEVEIQLLNIGGSVIYRNNAGKLEAGHYSLPVQVGSLPAGIYLLKFMYGNKWFTSTKVVKQ